MSCDRCDDNVAIISCVACGFNFCQACDTEVHSVARLKDHIRDALPNVEDNSENATQTQPIPTPQMSPSSPPLSRPQPALPPAKPSPTMPPKNNPPTIPMATQNPSSPPPSRPQPALPGMGNPSSLLPSRPQPALPGMGNPSSPPPSHPPVAGIPQFSKQTPKYGMDPGIPPPPPDDLPPLNDMMGIPPPPPDDAPNAPPKPMQPFNGQRHPPASQGSFEIPSPASNKSFQLPTPAPAKSFEIPTPATSKSFQLPTPAPAKSFESPLPATSKSFEIPTPNTKLRMSADSIPVPQSTGAQQSELLPSGGPPRSCRIVLIGTGGVGKSAVTIRFTQGSFTEDEYDPTIEDNYKKNWVVDGKNYVLQILDTAGQEEYSSLRDGYMRTGDGFIVVYAINSVTTWNEVTELRNQILRAKDVSTVPMVLVGNKCDLEQDRKISREQGMELATKWSCAFIEASAKANINVDEIFSMLVREIEKFPQDSANSDDKKKTGKKFSVMNLFGKKK